MIMYRIVEENHQIAKRKLYFIERERSFLGYKWWSRTTGVEELDDNPYGFFYTYIHAKRALNIINEGNRETVKLRVI
tara:strand:- start:177 stop:407 length:231 start_codon:yes stop_codon:yes gene_type:complete